MVKQEQLTRKEALALGLKTYTPKRPCKRCGGTVYYTNHPVCVACKSAYISQWQKENKERMTNTRRQWQRENKERLYAMGKFYRQENPDKTKDVYKRSKIKRRAKATAHENLRRAKKLQACPSWVNLQHIADIYVQAKRLSEIIGIKYHVDHIVPLNHPGVCGLHVPWNLQIIPAWQNVKKGNSFEY